MLEQYKLRVQQEESHKLLILSDAKNMHIRLIELVCECEKVEIQ